jgi:hypothetical protein
MKLFILFAVVFTVVAHCAPTYSDNTMDPLKEYRYCGEPTRDANGVITRDQKVIAAFRELNPCPSTGMTTGACPRWSLNHEKPRACGGCDAVYNLVWAPNIIKSSAGIGIDRYERQINGGVAPNTPACTAVPLGGIKYPTSHGTLDY